MSFKLTTKSSGAFAPTYLAQAVAAPLEHWGVTKENATYFGPALRVERVDNSVQTDIGWASDGKNADAAALTAVISGTTGRLAKVYGQMGIADATQTTSANMPLVQVGTDGKIEILGGSNKWIETASTAFKTAKVHVFMAAKFPYASSLSLVNSGCMFCYGPSGAYFTSARYGLGLEWQEAAAIEMPPSWVGGGYQSERVQGTPGEAYKAKWTLYDCSSNTYEVRADKVQLMSPSSNVDMSYTQTDKLIIGNDNGNNNPMSGSWRSVSFYSATQTTTVRDQITDQLSPNLGVTILPTTVTIAKAAGFNWTPVYIPLYGTQRTADANNINWVQHNGGYPWSYWEASNVSNGVSYVRFEVRPNDSDVVINDSERCEQAGFLGGNTTSTGVILPGDDFEIFAQFLIEGGAVSQTGNWCDAFQVHYDDATESPNTADLVLLDLHTGNMQPSTQRNEVASGARTPRGSSVAIQYDTWFAFLIQGHWDAARGSADTLKFYLDVNSSSSLTQTFTGTGAFFDTNAALAYLKRGIYRGFPNTNTGNLAMQIANYKFSKTAGAFSGLITSSGRAASAPLPTHS